MNLEPRIAARRDVLRIALVVATLDHIRRNRAAAVRLELMRNAVSGGPNLRAIPAPDQSPHIRAVGDQDITIVGLRPGRLA